MTTLDLPVRASTYGKEPSELTARVHDYTRPERMRRGLRAAAPVFGIACCVLLLPPHIPWFTLTSIVAVVTGIRQFRREREFASLAGACPSCGKVDDLTPPESLPKIQRCAACGAFLKLELV